MLERLEPNLWSENRIVNALVSRYWFNCTVMVEWEIDGGRADFVVISKSLYLTEIEIKITAEDWKNDMKKLKWSAGRHRDKIAPNVTRLRPHVTRFFYCVPEFLVDQSPVNLGDDVGILSIVTNRRGFDRVRLVRQAKRLKGAKKVPEKTIAAIYKASYYRFWRQTLNTAWSQRIRDLEERRKHG